MKLSISEILSRAGALKAVADKVNFLHQHKTSVLINLLQACYDPRLEWMLPKGAAPFKPSQLSDQEGSLYFNERKLYLFLKFNGTPLHRTLKQTKREMLFIELLETLSPSDASFIVAIKDKKMPYSGITQSLIEVAFPGEIYFGEPKPVTPKIAKPKRAPGEPPSEAESNG